MLKDQLTRSFLIQELNMSDIKLDPAVQQTLDDNKIVYEVLPCDPDLADTVALCGHYGFSPGQAANTIVVSSKK
jgi:hypothetical protein